MPPRKKTAVVASDNDVSVNAPVRATRSSTRTATTNTSKPTSKANPPSKAAGSGSASKAKSASKRPRAESDDEEAPAAKKSKGGDLDKDKSDDTADDVDADKPKKMVTVLKRGAAPVDPFSDMVATHQVYANGKEVWDAMLNQTDLGKNANKFYVLQLLHPVGDVSGCMLFTRWGRVGENGASKLKGAFAPAQAVAEFKKQFKSKTAIEWKDRKNKIPPKGKYTWIERAFEEEEQEDKAEGSSGKSKEEEIIPESALALELQMFCKLIFSTTLMNATLSALNYDANKLPLGKLAKSTILSGFAALKELAEVLENPTGDLAKTFGGAREACDELTGRYYSIIPHAFGRTRPPTIRDMDTLKRELDLVDALGDMEVASKLIADSTPRDQLGNVMNPLDAHFKSLGLSSMEPIDQASKEFDTLKAYVHNTHGHTHHFQAQVQCAFRVERQAETDAWKKSKFNNLADGERLLLWHGSRSTNFAGILKQGLRIAPPQAPVTGYMFGKGVYFADMMSKSANYCHAYLSENIGVLLLCEVAVSPWIEMNDADYNADEVCKEQKKLATKGVGQTQPNEWQDAGEALDNVALRGCKMPKGKSRDVRPPGAWLQYNEYIVYDASQIRVRYLLMVKMG